MTDTYKSKIEVKRVCKKCKAYYLSVDGSKCPECSRKNKELAAKREANRSQKKEAEENGYNNGHDQDQGQEE